jgi:hypothetical protein
VRRSARARELLIFFAFLGLTLIMTWPWVTHIRDAVSDPGDPYLNAWTIWWDYHQTFHDPINLFHANIFFPYRYSLAFSESLYGIALFCFPLFALGLQPLTVHGIATLLAFAFSGYGAFRLARTLTGSTAAAWVAGIAFAFVPYRFGQLPHLTYLSAGWIPLTLEALVLFVRQPTRKRAAWLGLAFFMNALSAIHWFVLTLIPLCLSAMALMLRHRTWKAPEFWRRGLSALALASIALIPFLLPYARAAELYGFVRNPTEALFYSAKPIDWLVGEDRSKIWQSFNINFRAPERALFPGLLQPLLAMAAVFLVTPFSQRTIAPARRRLAVGLDALAITLGVLIVTIPGFGGYRGHVLGYPLSVHNVTPIACVLFVVLLARVLIAYPEIVKQPRESNIIASLSISRRSDGFWIGMIWVVLGFCGSLGMNFVFHRALYISLPLFRSIRVPARWAMIAYLGLALLAGLGAKQLVDLLKRHRPKLRPAFCYVVIVLAMLVDQRAAPLELERGAVDSDALTLRLKQTSMAGGIVELPTGDGQINYLYVLRAADHGRPLVTAVSGFVTPIQTEIETLTHDYPVPDRFIDLLESIPCSYLVVNHAYLDPYTRASIEGTVGRAISAGRVRFIRSYDESDLYAIVKTEPGARSEANVPESVTAAAGRSLPETVFSENEAANPIDDPQFFTRMQYLDFLGREPERGGLDFWTTKILACGEKPACVEQARASVSVAFFNTKEFQETAYFVYRVYQAALGRAPSYSEFAADRAKLAVGPGLNVAKTTFVEGLIKQAEFTRLYSIQLSADQFVDALLNNLTSTSGVKLDEKRPTMVAELNGGGSRASVVRELAEDQALAQAEYNRAFVLMHYFAYFKRDPEPADLAFWLDALDRNAPNAAVDIVRTFINSKEYRARFAGQKTNENSKQANRLSDR